MSGSRLRSLTASPSGLACTLRLLALGSIGVSRTRWLLENASPERVVECLVKGSLPPNLPDPTTEVRAEHVSRWSEGLRSQDVDALIRRNTGGDHAVIDAGDPRWPFHDDPDPPILLFCRGDIDLMSPGPRRVAIVGTRRCSAIGRSVAGEIGFALAEQGIGIVSGLALGIDGAAHRGAGASGHDPGRIGVVASGLDMVYPPRNAELWESVGRTGLLMSETPMGERATRWRFPARNRLIAGLSELVVVVESHERGGALLTVDEAVNRGIDVAVVPGSVTSRSCAGSNQLLMDGVPPVRHAQDILDHLGIDFPVRLSFPDPQEADAGRELDELERRVVDALDGGPVVLDALGVDLGLATPDLLQVVQRLRRSGHLRIDGSLVTNALRERG